jgi:hypothetical protein
MLSIGLQKFVYSNQQSAIHHHQSSGGGADVSSFSAAKNTKILAGSAFTEKGKST